MTSFPPHYNFPPRNHNGVAKNGILDLRDGFKLDHYAESEVCHHCIRRLPCIVFTDDLRIVPLCQECLENDYHMDFYFFKYFLMMETLVKIRNEWNGRSHK